METDALCYGFRSFGQLIDDSFLSVLAQLRWSHDKDYSPSVKSVTFAWSRCYILLVDNSLIVQGFVDSEMECKKRIPLPFNDELKKILCLREYDLFLTERGHCWKYSRSGDFSCVNVSFKDEDRNSKKRKIIDVVSNGNDLKFNLFDSGVLYDSHDLLVTLPGIKIKKVCCGFEHNVCLSDNGSVYVWGNGSRGQLGNGSLLPSDHPELLELLDGLFVVDIDAGGWHSVAMTTCGALYSWGWNNFGQLGFRTDRNTEMDNDDVDANYISVLPEPRLVEWSNNTEVVVKQVACGNLHTVILSEDGLVWGCGCNKYGQLNPHSKREFFDEMTCVPVSENVKIIHRISCACWNTTLYGTISSKPCEQLVAQWQKRFKNGFIAHKKRGKK